MTRRAANTLPVETREPSHGSVKQFAGGAAGIAIILFVYYALARRSFAGLITAFGGFSNLFSDFETYYYPMGKAVFRTGLPVEGFLYSPFVAILLAVFPSLGLNASLVLWGILQVAFVIFYLLLFRWLVPAALPIQLLFVALVLSSYPLLLNFMGGSVNVFMIVGLLGMLVLNGRGHRAAAAGLFAFAVSFKLYPIIFLAPFAARRDHRLVIVATAACGTFLFVVPSLLLGVGDTLRFYGALLDSFRESDWVVANPNSNYFPHVVLRLADAMGHDSQAHLPLLRWIAYGVAAANMGLILLVERARLRHAGLWSFQLVFLTIPFVLKTSWPHDFVFLSVTQALLIWRLLEGAKAAPGTDTARRSSRASAWRDRIRHWRAAVPLSLVLASIGLSNIVFFNLVGDRDRYGSYGFLLWANLLLLVALYVELLPPALRRLRASQAV